MEKHMARIHSLTDSQGNKVALISDVETYATEVAAEAVHKYIELTQGSTLNTGVSEMNKSNLSDAAAAVISESTLNAKIISGELLLDNIQTLAQGLVFSRLSWWQKLAISPRNKEAAITLAMYALVHALKTGGFGLTSYRVNHVALDYVSLAANQRILKYIISSTGVNTNVAEMLFSAPTITKEV